MGAIPKHKTSVVDKPWDGSKNEKNLKLDQNYEYYRKMYAWVDPDGDKSKKTSYKFPHHEVSSDGEIGAANIRGCQSAIAVLNGAMGGAKIPDSDKRGVYNHVASHLRDADIEPAELKSIDIKMEVRSYPFEIRAEKDDIPKIFGYSAVFEQLSEDLGGFREKIRKGAFSESIKNDDIRALFNHDPNYVLGRNKNETLLLEEDDHGLKIEIIPPETQWAKDLIYSIRRGDIDQMSFGFTVLVDEWNTEDKDNPIRTLVKVKLYDISPVTFPAYPQTSVAVRTAKEVFRDFTKSLQEKEKLSRNKRSQERLKAIIDCQTEIAKGELKRWMN